MKMRFLSLILVLCLMGCSSDDRRQNNPNLLDLQFDIVLNLNLPQFSQLNFAGNAIYFNSPGIGNDGIIVVNTGSGFVAWDASDPNEIPRDCTRLIISGLSAASTCQNPNSYSIVSGQPLEDGLQYGLLSYRVTENAGSVRVFN